MAYFKVKKLPTNESIFLNNIFLNPKENNYGKHVFVTNTCNKKYLMTVDVDENIEMKTISVGAIQRLWANLNLGSIVKIESAYIEEKIRSITVEIAECVRRPLNNNENINSFLEDEKRKSDLKTKMLNKSVNINELFIIDSISTVLVGKVKELQTLDLNDNIVNSEFGIVTELTIINFIQ